MLGKWDWTSDKKKQQILLGATAWNIPMLNIDYGKVRILVLVLTTEEFHFAFLSHKWRPRGCLISEYIVKQKRTNKNK